ncbi:hypothetical protein Tco_1003012 [Tanacetum coccineum]|uniref:Uncharacterized protein n=1 Tax=Tanacetum coccineum TaxID=301880 RepID=A0ABQ5F904_9ASTR
MLSLRERMELDLEARLMGETLVLNRSLDPFFEDYIELKNLNVPLELRRDQVDDLMPTIEEGEVVEEFRARNDARMVSKFFGYPSDCDHDKKIRIDCAHNLKFSCMIGPRCKEIDKVGEVSKIWKSGSVGVLKLQDGCSTHNLAPKINMENLPSKISGEFLILILLFPVFNLVLLVQSYNCLFRVSAAGTKLQLLKDYNCSRIKTAEKIKIDWRSRILIHDYTLWEIVENGNAPIVTKTVDGKETVIPPTSVEEKAQRRAELKARSTLFVTPPNWVAAE